MRAVPHQYQHKELLSFYGQTNNKHIFDFVWLSISFKNFFSKTSIEWIECKAISFKKGDKPWNSAGLKAGTPASHVIFTWRPISYLMKKAYGMIPKSSSASEDGVCVESIEQVTSQPPSCIWVHSHGVDSLFGSIFVCCVTNELMSWAEGQVAKHSTNESLNIWLNNKRIAKNSTIEEMPLNLILVCFDVNIISNINYLNAFYIQALLRSLLSSIGTVCPQYMPIWVRHSKLRSMHPIWDHFSTEIHFTSRHSLYISLNDKYIKYISKIKNFLKLKDWYQVIKRVKRKLFCRT